MNLQTFFSSVHRRGRTGAAATDFSNTAANRDILNALNVVMFIMWRKHAWDYSVEGYSMTVAAGTDTDITIPSSDEAGQLLVMYLTGHEGTIDPITLKYYHQVKRSVPAVNGIPKYFVRRGMDSNKNLRFRLVPAPQAQVEVNIDAKQKLTPLVFADLTSNIEIPFFPEYTHDILLDGVLEIIHQTQGDGHEDDAILAGAKFKQGIKDLIADDQTNKPDEDIVERLDDDLRLRNKLRGQDTGVY